MQRCAMLQPTASSSGRCTARWRSSLPPHRASSGSRPRPTLQVLRSAAEPAVTASVAAVPSADVAAQLSEEQVQQWVECVEQLQHLGFSAEESDKTVARAFGWSSQVYWLNQRVNQPPRAEQVASAIAYLQGLGMAPDDLTKVINAFPEVVGCSVDPQLQAVMKKLEKDWRMSGDVAVKAVLRQPIILGYTIDCVGDCVGECRRCWARF